jgi:hypothetical protein
MLFLTILDSSWINSAFKFEYAVKTVEKTFAISGKDCTFQLFDKKFVEASKAKKYRFLHGDVKINFADLYPFGRDSFQAI